MPWQPDTYVLGNYFQTQINQKFINDNFHHLKGNILDVGCGDGAITYQLAERYPKANFIGIDSVEEMISHASHTWQRNNLSFEYEPAELLYRPLSYSTIISFWCLHWTNINKSLAAIYSCLKKGGKFYSVFSSLSHHSFLEIWKIMLDRNVLPDLNSYFYKQLHQKSSFLLNVIYNLSRLNLKKVQVDCAITSITLPSINDFDKLFLTMPFTEKVPKADMQYFIEQARDIYLEICHERHDDNLVYQTRPISIIAIK